MMSPATVVGRPDDVMSPVTVVGRPDDMMSPATTSTAVMVATVTREDLKLCGTGKPPLHCLLGLSQYMMSSVYSSVFNCKKIPNDTKSMMYLARMTELHRTVMAISNVKDEHVTLTSTLTLIYIRVFVHPSTFITHHHEFIVGPMNPAGTL